MILLNEKMLKLAKKLEVLEENYLNCNDGLEAEDMEVSLATIEYSLNTINDVLESFNI